MRPFGSRYQLRQPLLHIVRAWRACRAWSNACCAWTLTSTLHSLSRRRRAMAWRVKCTWASIMKIIELWPRPVFGPVSMKKLGKPAQAMPR
ncbi:hypothetical protein D3C84_1051710 [compost metagenome]